MATQAWSSPMSTASDAAFNAWVNELYQYFTAAGLVQSSDTGQLAYPYSGGRGGTNNTEVGYWMFYLNDSLFSTAPIYIRIAPGRGGSLTTGRVMVAAGTSTNGAGTLTGDFTPEGQMVISNSSSGTNLPSRICVVNGFVGIAWKVGGGASSNGAFYLCRTCDNSGAATGEGFWLGCANANLSVVMSRVTSVDAVNNVVITTTDPASCQSALVPMGLSASSMTAAGDLQAFQCFGAFRKVFPLVGVCAVITAEGTDGATFSVAMVGTTPRTYIVNGTQYSGNPTAGNFAYYAMLWE